MATRKSILKNIVSGCVVCSKYRIEILNAKSTGKELLNIFITEPFIKKMVSFWDSIKKFKRSHQWWSIKKLLLKILQYSQENLCVRATF